MSKNVKAYLKVYDKFIDKKLCKSVVKKLNKSEEWRLHTYNNYAAGGELFSTDKELSVMAGESLSETNEITNLVVEALKRYQSELPKKCATNFISRCSQIRYNKYKKGTVMQFHCDHIHTLFDGVEKGIPALSVLGALNDDYEGGELVFWRNTPIELKTGSLMVFPSNFMYPHQVNEVTKGTRYSFVSWAW